MRQFWNLKFTGVCVAAFAAGLLFAGNAHADGSTIKIGVLTDMSGPYQDLAGPGSVFAVGQAVAEFKGEINGKKISVVSADTQNKVDIASSIARKWYTDEGVDVIVSITGSGIALAVVELAKQYNKAAFVTSSLTTQLTNENCSLNSLHYGIDTYALANGTVKGILAEGKKSWFLIAVDYAFGKSLAADTEAFLKAGGGELKGVAYHPLNNMDFASQLLRAKDSKADVIAIANAGSDLVITVKQAAEFGLQSEGQSVAALALWITDTHAMGINNTQGMLLTQAFYWNMDDQTRAFARPFFKKMGKMPTSYHAAEYSVIRHFLKAAAAGADWTDGRAIIAKMKQSKVDDFYGRGGYIREDGALIHDLFLFRVKRPEEVKEPWDYYDVIRTIPAESAFLPALQSRCALMKAK